MFTGIIEGLGTITGIRTNSESKRLSIKSDFDLNIGIGDSVAVNGVCLTAVIIDKKYFEADVAFETLKKTTLDRIKIGDKLNLERALCLSDRLNGHLVTGHVDGIGTIKKIKKIGNSILITIDVSNTLNKYIVDKGSVAVDGISLTVCNLKDNSFDLSIIPHTLDNTTLCLKKNGAFVNIETDIIGKYIERIFINKTSKHKTNNNDKDLKDLLLKTGFF